MEFKTNKIDDNVFELIINIPKDEYTLEVNNLLKKKRQEVDLKGFRKGKAPMGFMRRTFGNQILADIINKKIDSGLSEYLKDNNIELMLSPLSKEGQEPLDIDVNKMEDVSVTFSLHKKPDLNLKGISNEDSYTYYNIELDPKTIDSEVERFSNQYGKFEAYDGKLKEEHFINVNAKELEGDEIKKDGYDTEFTIKIAEISKDYKKEVLKLKKGDEFIFDVYKLLEDADDKKVRDYLLNINEGDFKEGEDIGIGNMFKGTIKNTEKYVPAELNEEFFKEVKIPNINSKEDYIKLISDDIKKHYTSESDKLLQLDIAERLKEINEFSFSEEYVNRWIREQYPDLGEDEINKNLENSFRDLKWQAIVDNLIKKYKVEVTKEDLAKKMEQQAVSMIGNNPQMISQMIEYMMQDEKLVNSTYNELFIDKIFSAASNDITKVEEKISWDDFIKMAEKYNKTASPEQ